MLYIAKSGICLSVFLIIYVLFLRKTTFFTFNRFFLLSGFVISFIVPLVELTYDVFIPVSIISSYTSANEIPDMVSTTVVGAESSSFNIWNILITVYVIGILFQILRNARAYTKVKALIKNGMKMKTGSISIIDSESIGSPFTVFNYVLINMNRLSDVEKNLILKHETTHIQQKHWFDLLCCEITLILQWFNPFAWLYIFYIKENHEFLADKAVIKSGISPVLYQAVLVNQRFQGPVFSFSNSFNYSKSLNRLVMIKKEKSSPWKRLTALIIVPAMGLFIWASAKPNYVIENQDLSLDKLLYEYLENSSEDGLKDSIKKSTTTIHTTIINDTDGSTESQTITYVDNHINNLNTKGTPVTINYVATNLTKDSIGKSVYFINSGNKLPLVFIDDVKSSLEKIKDLDKNEIGNINVLKDESATAEYGEDGKSGVMKIYTKKYLKNNPQLQKDLEKKKKSAFIFNGDSVRNGIYTKVDSLKGNIITVKGLSTMSGSKPLILVDGEKVESMNGLEEKGIRNIKVYKNSEAIDIFGASGKNGVIIINTQDNTSSSGTTNTLTVKSAGKSGTTISSFINNGRAIVNPLIIIDGEEKEGTSFKNLQEDDVESLSILKDKAAIEKYGDKGKNGVIIIELKKK